jgi:hypothetical protein
MEKWQESPLSFGEVLDVTFRIIKENFFKLFQIMLIFIGPAYLLQAIGMMSEGLPLLPDANRGVELASLFSGFTQAPTQGAYAEPGAPVLILIGVSILLMFISLPMAYASIIIITEQFRKQETVNISSIIRRAFSRFWALLGGSIVYGLIVTGLYIGMAAIIVGYLATNGLFKVGKGLAAASTAGLGTHIGMTILLSLIALFGFAYLMTRWSFFFAAIVIERVSPGISKSWQLTRGYFWRLVGLYLIVAIINGIILMVLQMGVNLILGGSVLGLLLNSFVSLLMSMLPFIAYAVIYFDLRVRNEGTDLKELLGTYQVNPVVSSPYVNNPVVSDPVFNDPLASNPDVSNPSASNPDKPVEQKQQDTPTTEKMPWD